MTGVGTDTAIWDLRAAELAALRAGGRWPHGPSTALGVLGRGESEAAHARYLAFLLDPRGSHGLGTALLAALLRLAGRADLAADAVALAEAAVTDRATGPVVVSSPRFTLVVELRIRAAEGRLARTGCCADPVFVYLTPSGRSASAAGYRPVSLLRLSRDLAAALRTPPRGDAPEDRGRAVARDYLNALEDVLGMSPVNDAAARFWLTHGPDMAVARQAARELLVGLPERTHAALAELALRLGDDLEVAWIDYQAVDGPEVAVVLGRRDWLTPGGPRCGFGLGQQRDQPGQRDQPDQHRDQPDQADRVPFVGFYCEDDAMRDAVSRHFDRRQRGRHWARWAPLPLRPEPRMPVLEGLARRVAESVTMGWREDAEVMERFRSGTRGD